MTRKNDQKNGASCLARDLIPPAYIFALLRLTRCYLTSNSSDNQL